MSYLTDKLRADAAAARGDAEITHVPGQMLDDVLSKMPMKRRSMLRGSIGASLTAIFGASALSACGGGGSDSAAINPTPPDSPTTPLVRTSVLTQGRWVSTGLNPAYTAIMVPATTGANTPAVDTLWALAQDATSLIKLKANEVAALKNGSDSRCTTAHIRVKNNLAFSKLHTPAHQGNGLLRGVLARLTHF